MKSLLANLVLIGLALQLALAGGVVVRKLWRPFPIFTAYAIWNVLSTVLFYPIRRAMPGSQLDFYAYWICEAVSVVLGFGVVYELFQGLLKPYAALTRIAANASRWVLAGLVLLACVVAYLQPSGLRHFVASAVGLTEETARIVEVGLLAFLFAFSRVFGLHWRQNVFGIALGLGIFTSVELAGIALHTRLGAAAYQGFALARALAFNGSVLIWIGYILAPERVTSVAELPKRDQLEQWNQAMMELIRQ